MCVPPGVSVNMCLPPGVSVNMCLPPGVSVNMCVEPGVSVNMCSTGCECEYVLVSRYNYVRVCMIGSVNVHM